MPKLGKDEVLGALNSYIEKSLKGDSDENVTAATDKAVKSISNKIDGIVNFIKDNVHIETPKTVEEIVKEQMQPILDKLDKKEGTVKEKKDEDSATVGDIKKIVKDVVTESLKNIVKDKSKPKGNGADDAIDKLVRQIAKDEGLDESELDDEPTETTTEETTEDTTDETIEEPVAKNKGKNKSGVKLETVETHDSLGKELSTAERVKRQQLDNFIGNTVQGVIEKLKDND